MKFQFAASAPASADAIAYPIAKGGLDEAAGRLPDASSTLIRASAGAARFDGRCGRSFETFIANGDAPQRIVLVGTSKGEPIDLERAGGTLAARLLTSGAKSVTVDFSGSGIEPDGVARFLFGMEQRAWRIDTYRTRMKERHKTTLSAVTVVTSGGKAPAGWHDYKAIAQGIALTRELVSEPANIIYPESFVERCRHLADLGVEISVLDDKEMAKLGMGALLGVAQGSARKPRLLALRWNGSGKASSKPLALVGKGVTFDTGGISIKAAPGMEDMKWDMGGAAAVAGTIKALALRKSKADVVGVCGLVENMPDGNAQRPGDIVTTMSGQTIEVLNTDAEGRLVLADAVWWTQEKFKCDTLIDLATLTGAIMISLGQEYAGMFSNDDALAEKLNRAGLESGDKLWRMPIGKAYDKLIDSQISDMKNLGPKFGGSITAAQLIKRFIKDGTKWAHLDIAGMVWSDKDSPTAAKGATGYGVRLLNRFIADNHEG